MVGAQARLLSMLSLIGRVCQTTSQQYVLTLATTGSALRTKTKGSEAGATIHASGTLKDFVDAAENPNDSVNLLDMKISVDAVPWPIE